MPSPETVNVISPASLVDCTITKALPLNALLLPDLSVTGLYLSVSEALPLSKPTILPFPSRV